MEVSYIDEEKLQIKKEREKYFNERLELVDKMSKLIQELSSNMKSDVKIQNIGITLNNKIVELIHIFSKKNKEIVRSKLFDIINNYFIRTYSEARTVLDITSSVVNLAHVDPSRNIDKNKLSSLINEQLDLYKDLDDNIFNFSIENNIKDAFDSEQQYWKRIEADGGFSEDTMNKDKVVTGLNNELKELGYNIVLSLNSKKQGL